MVPIEEVEKSALKPSKATFGGSLCTKDMSRGWH